MWQKKVEPICRQWVIPFNKGSYPPMDDKTICLPQDKNYRLTQATHDLNGPVVCATPNLGNILLPCF